MCCVLFWVGPCLPPPGNSAFADGPRGQLGPPRWRTVSIRCSLNIHACAMCEYYCLKGCNAPHISLCLSAPYSLNEFSLKFYTGAVMVSFKTTGVIALLAFCEIVFAGYADVHSHHAHTVEKTVSPVSILPVLNGYSCLTLTEACSDIGCVFLCKFRPESRTSRSSDPVFRTLTILEHPAQKSIK